MYTCCQNPYPRVGVIVRYTNLHLSLCCIKPDQNIDDVKSMITKLLAVNCSYQCTKGLYGEKKILSFPYKTGGSMTSNYHGLENGNYLRVIMYHVLSHISTCNALTSLILWSPRRVIQHCANSWLMFSCWESKHFLVKNIFDFLSTDTPEPRTA